MERLEFVSPSAEKTKYLGFLLASLLSPGDVILLSGDLGAGKTTFVSGVAKGLHIDENVISPTFNILKCYFHGDLPMYHIDAYRLEGQPTEIGLDEFIEGDGTCFIEWPQYIEKLIPDEHLDLAILNKGESERLIQVSSSSPRFQKLIAKWQEAAK